MRLGKTVVDWTLSKCTLTSDPFILTNTELFSGEGLSGIFQDPPRVLSAFVSYHDGCFRPLFDTSDTLFFHIEMALELTKWRIKAGPPLAQEQIDREKCDVVIRTTSLPPSLLPSQPTTQPPHWVATLSLVENFPFAWGTWKVLPALNQSQGRM